MSARLQEEMGHGWQQPKRTDHVPEEHERQEDTHVRLELDRGKCPANDADRQRDTREPNRLSC